MSGLYEKNGPWQFVPARLAPPNRSGPFFPFYNRVLTLIENGELYAPGQKGKRDILVASGQIEKVGSIDRRKLDALGLECDVIDATGCIVAPGFIDPHEHLLGGSGEGSLALQSPELFIDEICRAGITTVVGTLGVDTTMKTLPGLLARVKALKEEGLSAYLWTGGYNVPPTTMLDDVRQDMMFIDECIGAGEIAISDERSLAPDLHSLARVVLDAHIGGLLTGKAGLTHFHVGESDKKLGPILDLLENFDIKPEWLFPTHVQRSKELMEEAIAFANDGMPINIDVVDEDAGKWTKYYLDRGGPPENFTISSDADSTTPDVFYGQICELVVKHKLPLELVLAFVTSNTARTLKLESKGRVAEGCDADLVVLTEGALEIREVISGGKRLVVDGQCKTRSKFLAQSSRNVTLVGAECDEPIHTEQ
ncbi:MAG TPA: amidohydrolase family protein [Gemmatimonadaceae bacterium]|jgi:beta-aspartyl-dipeptidase (metallo-type)|nr:amidohydrolase family protein [Gemmatimonadaceae bacterium]